MPASEIREIEKLKKERDLMKRNDLRKRKRYCDLINLLISIFVQDDTVYDMF